MPSPTQTLESCSTGPGQFMWRQGQGLPLEKPGLELGPRSTLFEAQIDEHVAKGLIGQKKLISFCRKMTGVISGASVTNPGIKKRPTIVEKIQKRGKQVHEVNDVTRATVTFHHLAELYAADAWVQSQPEFKRIAALGGTSRKNRYTELASDGDYRDIKMFLAFPVRGSAHPWVVELQLNLKVAMKNKGIGHGIYEITRLGDAVPMDQVLPVPADKVMRITKKLRSCYVALRKTGIEKSLLEKFRLFIYRHFEDALDHLEDANYSPKGCTISPEERSMLNQVSVAVYTYSFKVAKNAVAYKDGHMEKLIGASELMKR